MVPACAACGSTVGVERHHLYPRSMGCPDDLTVPLCHECHGRTHQMRRRVNIAEATREGLKKAKARGTRLGNPNGAAALRRARKGNKASIRAAQENADRFAADLRPVLMALRAEGITSLRATAAALNDRGYLTPRGGHWHPSSVRNLVDRAEVLGTADRAASVTVHVPAYCG